VVFYRLKSAETPLPPGVQLMNGSANVDIVHHGNSRWVEDADFLRCVGVSGAPWVASCHADPARWGIGPEGPPDNWIFVSRTIAARYGKSRYVLNGIDPAEYVYSETKNDYFAFMCNFRNATEKGLDVALHLSIAIGFKLVVAGPCVGMQCTTEEIGRECAAAGAAYIGDVRGEQKAEFLAGARALLFPTRVNEAFGLVIAEALMSGTPVISSPMGACRELVSPDVGFVCERPDEYARAIENIDSISPASCRRKALAEYHYLAMARNYAREYEKELGGGASNG